MELEQFKRELGEVDLHRVTIGYLVSGNSVWDLLSQCFGESGLVDMTYEDLLEHYQHCGETFGLPVKHFRWATVNYWLGCCDRVEEAQMSHIEG